MSKCTILVLILVTIILLCIGLVGSIIGAVGDAWWTKNGLHSGLVKVCMPKCVNRDNVLSFKKFSRELDAILLALILAAIFALFGLISALVMAVVNRRKHNTNMTALITTLCAFISAMASLAALIYAESQFKKDWDIFNHGWSVIICWIGGLSTAIAFILSFVLICQSSSEKHESHASSYQNNRGTHVNQGGVMADRSVNGHANQGYELQ